MERSYTVRELGAALYRRRRLALAVAAGTLVVAGASILMLPPEYRAQSVVQIEPHVLPADFFPAVSASFEERMRSLKHGLLARPVLEKVLDETQLEPRWRKDPDKALERLRRNVEVRLEGEVSGGPPSLLFAVAVRGKDPRKVAQAASIIPHAYAEMTKRVLSIQARNVRMTLERQQASLGRQLADEEEKLVAFKREHAAEVPEANDSNLRAAGAIATQLELHLAAIAEAQRRRGLVRASIPETHSEAGNAEANAEEVLRRLEAARAAYGEDHPVVKRLTRQYEEARQRNAEEQRRFKEGRLAVELDDIAAEVRVHEAAVRGLRKELAMYQRRLDAAPLLGEQYRALSSDLESVRGKYTSTLSRVADAQAAEALLAADSPTMFHELEPAVAPTRPVGPKRLELFLVAIAAALGAGLLAAAGAEYFDTSLRGAQDATEFGVPVLAAIPRIGPRQARR
jgi:succinoglycan biosynthesis transport protein ExoP